MKKFHILKKYPPFETVSTNIEQYMIQPGNLPDVNLLRTLFSLIDLTTLEVTDTEKKVILICEKVNHFKELYPDIPNVASICIYPSLVETVRRTLKAQEVGITSVTGGFPSSQTSIEVKELETEIVLLDGATEADMVMSVGSFRNGNIGEVYEEIVTIKKIMGKRHLKIILETGALSPEEVWHASLLAMEAGADFIKTSTGKFNPAATPEAVLIMCQAIREYFKASGKQTGIKPAGGIATSAEACIYYQIVKGILGDEWLQPELFRIGASRLANNLLAEIHKTEGKPFAAYF
jgi:deoxyribose-phosphate aldolase